MPKESIDAVPKDNPFATQTRCLTFETGDRLEQLARLTEGLGAREPFLLVTGESGAGKTTLIRDAIAHWESRVVVAFVANPALTRTELLEEIARRFGVEPPAGASKPQLLASIERVLADAAEQNRVALVVIDDAHQLDPELLDELRLLANAMVQAGRRLEIALVGLAALEARLSEPALAPLRQRIGVQCQVKPFSHKETRRFLHEVSDAAGHDGATMFPRETCRDIFQRSHGVPRAVCALAGDALRRALEVKAHVVTTDHVKWAATALGLGTATAAEAAGAARPPQAESIPSETGQAGRRAAVKSAADSEPARAGNGRTSAEDTTAPMPDATPSKRPASDGGDERVNDWVGRFIGPDEPRFGELMGMGRSAGQLDDAWLPAPNAPKGRARAPRDQNPTGADEADVADTAWSARRRDPLRARSRSGRGVGGPMLLPLSAALVVVVALAVIVVLPARRKAGEGGIESAAHVKQAEPGPAATEPAPLDVASTPKRPASVALRTPREASSAPAAKQAIKPAPKAPSPAGRQVEHPLLSSQSTGAEAASSPMALDVGTYINPERAEEERDRLAAETGLKAWVVEGHDGGVSTYRVVLGTYSTLERARSAANLLLSRGSVTEAMAIPLPPRSTRR